MQQGGKGLCLSSSDAPTTPDAAVAAISTAAAGCLRCVPWLKPPSCLMLHRSRCIIPGHEMPVSWCRRPHPAGQPAGCLRRVPFAGSPQLLCAPLQDPWARGAPLRPPSPTACKPACWQPSQMCWPFLGVPSCLTLCLSSCRLPGREAPLRCCCRSQPADQPAAASGLPQGAHTRGAGAGELHPPCVLRAQLGPCPTDMQRHTCLRGPGQRCPLTHGVQPAVVRWSLSVQCCILALEGTDSSMHITSRRKMECCMGPLA